MVRRFFTWGGLILAYLLVVVLALTGCSSTYVSTKVGETEYVWQMSLEKTEVEDE